MDVGDNGDDNWQWWWCWHDDGDDVDKGDDVDSNEVETVDIDDGVLDEDDSVEREGEGDEFDNIGVDTHVGGGSHLFLFVLLLFCFVSMNLIIFSTIGLLLIISGLSPALMHACNLAVDILHFVFDTT